VNPTLYVQRAGIERLRETREREGRLTTDLEALFDGQRRAPDTRIEAVGRMASAGVRMTAGSDSPWGWYAPGEFVHEIDMLAQAGLSYGDAIAAATTGAAESIGVGAVAGRLATGRQADVWLLGDPTREITAPGASSTSQAGARVHRGVMRQTLTASNVLRRC
jgi:imidazolonepropionase-like amidohydrolase